MESKYNYFSCFKYEEDNEPYKCKPFLTSENSQKAYSKLQRGYQKERISVHSLSDIDEDDTIVVYDKETYNPGETIKVKEVNLLDSLTEEDKNVIKNKNTCMYRGYARFVDPDNYIGEKKFNVSDKSVCYNADRFDELKDILDCGYATIKGKYNNKRFVFTNCYHILDTNADSDFQKAFNDSYSKLLFKYYYDDVVHIFINKAGLFTNADNTRRQLDSQEM